jgi:type IV pilus assembly protein PilA
VSAGLATNTSVTGKYVAQVDVSGGAIVAKFGKEANSKINGKFLTLSPYDNGGTIAWNCKAASGATQKTDVPDAYLPTACRP